ncbi:MAG: PAS domain S-box protein, partial [Candidatus Hodarchaeales archaeon]
RMSIMKKNDNGITIFHIDDDEFFLELTKVNLEEIDSRINVVSEQNPMIAMKKLIDSHEDFDVVVCDYDMKEFTGLEILANLRNEKIAIAFIILTGKGREEIVIKALNLGADYYIQKHIDSNVLYAELKHYILACVEKNKEKQRKKIAEIRYKNIFEESPLQFWLEDFSDIKLVLDELKAKNITDIRGYIDDHPEIVWDNIHKIKIIDANKASLKAIGVKSKDEVLGGLNKILGNEAFNIVKEEMIALAEGRMSFKLESLADTISERGRIFFDLRFSVVHGYEKDLSKVLVSAVDITELVNERNTLQHYLNISGVMFFALNTDGTVNMINKKGCEILGFSEEEIIGKNWFDSFILPGDAGSQKERFIKIMKGEIAPAKYSENYIITKNGQKRLIIMHNSLIKNHKDEIIGSLSSGEDITDTKRIETSFKEQIEETELFLNIITHDLKNYYLISKGFNELIISKNDLNRLEIENFAKKSNESITKAITLLDNISILMRDRLDKTYELYPVNIKEIVDGVKTKVTTLFSSKKIQYIEDINPDIFILADSLFEYLVLNLITNAVKNDDNDVVQIEISTNNDTGDNCLLTVSDHGHGIPPEIRKDLFSRYTEFRKKGTGSGLGMHIIKTLVNRYGGNMIIENRVLGNHEKGTIIKVLLNSQESGSE